MANTIKVLFWLHRSKANKEGLVPLVVRLTFKGKRAEKATGFYIETSQWNTQKQRLKGSKGSNIHINKRLDELMVRIAFLSREEGNVANVHLPSVLDQLFATSKE